MRFSSGFAEHLRQRYGGGLDFLVNNAGTMVLPKRTTNSRGLELQMATNYSGPFLLTALLFPLMKITGTQFAVSAPSIGIHDRPCVNDERQPMSRTE
ncbi:MAG: SDR family NAD(P)-dependent oxidoreductase [Acidobacteriaceae bacterium]|nr:SDR family NAD(P)-dependent oxidoreductase [Acidobacteriaceae bacterium]